MKIDDALIETIQKLARLGLSREEYGKYGKHLEQILAYVKVLGELELADARPEAANPSALLRADEEVPSAPTEDLLSNAPSRAGALFRVPRIIDRAEGP